MTSAGGGAVTYDANQNITSALGQSYSYDAANRLTGVSSNTLSYDPAGRLYTSSMAPRLMQYAGDQLVGEHHSISGVLLARHVPGPGLDQPVMSMFSDGNRIQQLADERQSVIGLTGPSGANLWINRYDEYGVPDANNSDRFQYTGQPVIQSGLYHYRARAYAPQLGRFLQSDPIGYQAGANLYGYVGGDPVNMVDPLGLQSIEVCSRNWNAFIDGPDQVNGGNWVTTCRWVDIPGESDPPISPGSGGNGNGTETATSGQTSGISPDECRVWVGTAEGLSRLSKITGITAGAATLAGFGSIAFVPAPAGETLAGSLFTVGRGAAGLSLATGASSVLLYGGGTGDWGPAVGMGIQTTFDLFGPIRGAGLYREVSSALTSLGGGEIVDQTFPMGAAACDR